MIRDDEFKRLWGQMKVSVGVLDGVEEKQGRIPADFLQDLLDKQLALNELMMRRIEQLEESQQGKSH